MRAIFCPRCHSSEIEPYAAGITGTYRCKKCGYVGTLIIEKDLVKRADEDEEESL